MQAYIAIAPSQPSRLYSSLADAHATHVYRSDDAGEHWTQITTDSRPAVRIGGGDLAIPAVDPKNPDVIYTASIVCWRSTDGGKTWTGIRGAPGGDDYQNLWINPDEPQHDSARERPGRDRDGEWRRDLEFLVQPTDGAALSRHCGRCVSLPRIRRTAGERLGGDRQPG